jgi:hypothetical protein
MKFGKNRGVTRRRNGAPNLVPCRRCRKKVDGAKEFADGLCSGCRQRGQGAKGGK